MHTISYKCIPFNENFGELQYLLNYTNNNFDIVATQFVIFKPLSCCFEETIGFDVKTSFASRPLSRLIR